MSTSPRSNKNVIQEIGRRQNNGFISKGKFENFSDN